MISSFVVALAATALFGLAVPSCGRRLRPGLAVWVLVVGSGLVTACSLAAGAAVALAGLGQIPVFAALGRWSPAAMRVANPFPPALGALAALVLAALLARAAVRGARHGRTLHRAWGTAAALTSDLVVCDDPEPIAYAVPGWPGRIVVSRSLLRSLDARGRRALLAHEQAHLDGRDDLLQFVTAVCVAANPLLWRLPDAVAAACERRADEAAARRTGDRRVVADAIATAVLPRTPAVALFAAGSDVVDRVEALLSPARRGLTPLLPVLLLLAAAAASVLWLGHDLDAITDAAAALR
jgi:hypothetical protein